MNPPPERILIVEIKTVERTSAVPEQSQEMIVYRDSLNRHYLSTGRFAIESAILSAIPRLGSNYRHPLLFDVQILTGDEVSAYLNSIGSGVPTGYPRRRKTR